MFSTMVTREIKVTLLLTTLLLAVACVSASPTLTPTPTPTSAPTPFEDAGFGGLKEEVREVPLQAQYALPQLRKWYEQMGQDTDIYSLPELTLTDLDEGKNLIEIGVACESDRDRVREELQKHITPLGIPLEAITITVRRRALPLITPSVFECIPPETVDPVTGLSTPGFGGLYLDSGIAYVYLLEPSQAVAEELVLNQVGRESFERLHEVRALKGNIHGPN